jgi:hypothetical protein
MLYDTILHSEPKPVTSSWNFTEFDSAFCGALREAQRFVLSQDVLRAAHHVAQVAPASVLSALHLLKPAYRRAWYEWATADYLAAPAK